MLNPLERVEIDCTSLDVFVVDNKNKLSLGRPYITSAVDVATGCLVGFHIGFKLPSSKDVVSCLIHGLSPKVWVRNKEIEPIYELGWNNFGIFGNSKNLNNQSKKT
jgi:putative transposase